MIHLERFVDRLRGLEARGSPHLVMSINEAKDLHADVTRLLLTLETLRNQVLEQQKPAAMTINVDGGQF